MTTCFRLLKDTDKATALREAIASRRAGEVDEQRTFTLDPDKFRKVPNTPFAYWVDDSIRDLFVKLPPFESEGRTVRVGLQTGDDFRFVRAWWEVDAERRLDPIEGGAPDWREDLDGFQKWCRNRTHQGKYWVPFAKGGEYSPYYSDIHLVVNWKNEGEEMKAFSGSVIRNPDYYFRPGVTWPLRAHRFNPRPLPAGCIFSVRGYSFFFPPTAADEILTWANSRIVDVLFKTLLGRAEYPEFIVGALSRLPYARVEGGARLPETRALVDEAARRTLMDPTQRLFDLESASFDQETQRLSEDADRSVSSAYGISEEVVVWLSAELGSAVPNLAPAAIDFDELLPEYAIAVAFGRIPADLLGDTHDIADPFDPLPAFPERLRGVSSTTHTASVVVLEEDTLLAQMQVYGQRITTTLSARSAPVDAQSSTEAHPTLSAPNGFFDRHLSRFSRSGRKAPIYWPLSTASGSYTIWLYYPRLDETTLFTAYQLARDKYDLLEKEMVELQAVPSGDRTKKQQKRFDEVVRDVAEVHEFAEEILRITKLPYKPDHDDGVPICAAPLYKLFRHNAWSKYLQGIWEDLESGKYDWAHLAYAIWPDRVREKAREDKSIAIAHGLEAET